jgi:hypothetical protein
MTSLRFFPRATESNHPRTRGYPRSCRSEIVALSAFSKAVFRLEPESRSETVEAS